MFDEGFDFVLEKIELKYLVPFRKRFKLRQKEIKKLPLGIRLRRLFEKLGPTFIKFGQILSLRPDVVGGEVARELEKLQERAQPFSPKIAKQIIEQELGKPIGKVFKRFDEKPSAAASLAQVHRAILKTGEIVALKIQKPNIKEKIEEDIHLMFHLAHLLEKIPEIALRRPVDLVKEFSDWTLRELDFYFEGQTAERFRKSLENVRGSKVPAVYWDYTTPRLLTMEFVDGININNAKALERAEIDTKKLAKIGFEGLFRQIFIDGFFQADPHPGNFFALKDEAGEDVLCFHDFGMVGYLSGEDKDKMMRAISSFVKKDIEGYLNSILNFVVLERDADKEGFLREARLISEKFMFAPLDTRAVVKVLPEILHVSLKYGVRFPGNLALLARSLLIMSNVGLKLDQAFDINKAAEDFVIKATLEKFKPDKLLYDLPSQILDYAEMLKRLPERTRNLLQKIEKGEISVKIDLDEFRNLKTELDRENDIRIFSILTAIVFLGSAILTAAKSSLAIFGVSLGYAGLGISGLMILWLLRLMRQKAK